MTCESTTIMGMNCPNKKTDNPKCEDCPWAVALKLEKDRRGIAGTVRFAQRDTGCPYNTIIGTNDCN